jgi:hypothetical protein
MIQLRAIVDALELQSDEMRAYLNRQTGEVVTVSKEELNAVEEGGEIEDFPAWQQENIRIANDIWETDHYVQLPNQFEIHEWSIMRNFCDTVEDARLRDELLRNVHGKGAFRHFKDSVYQHGIEKQWFHFRTEALGQIAINWLVKHNIPYQAD